MPHYWNGGSPCHVIAKGEDAIDPSVYKRGEYQPGGRRYGPCKQH